MKVSDAKTEILIMAKYRQFNVQLNRDSLYYHHKKLISSQIEEATSILVTDSGDQGPPDIEHFFDEHADCRE